jgi:Fe-Mn family superoxide dismutase
MQKEAVMNAKLVSRRNLLRWAAVGTVAAPWFLTSRAWAATERFTLPPLPWAEDALAPMISQKTISFHYGKHHAGYVTNLNKLIEGTPYAGMTLEEIIRKAPAGPLFNNAAQVWNHTFYWNCMAPGAGGEPTGALREAIDKNFGSFAKFKDQFTKTATTLFGSGWTWLVRNPNGSLAVVATSNAGTPLTGGQTPLLVCDVWEHAYYLDRQNRRPEYIEAFWKLVDWKAVERR